MGLSVCAQKGCPELTNATRCPAHERVSGGWRRPGQNAYPRIEGRKLQRLREALFAEEPFCRLCTIRVSEIRDHIIPLEEGGTEDRANIQALCRRCSDQKTAAEAARGRQRAGGG